MSFKRLVLLLRKEVRGTSSNFFFVFAVLVPLVLTFVVSVAFGSLFSESVRVGIVGDSDFAVALAERDFVNDRAYASEADLRDALAEGAVDLGVVIPADIDARLDAGEPLTLNMLVWGESLAQDRAVLAGALTTLANRQAPRETALAINTVDLGENDIPLEQRMVPFLVLMAVVIGGTLVPAGSLVEEKQKRTIRALTTSPTTLGEVLVAKGAMGAGVSWLVALLVLVLNQGLGNESVILLVALALGATMAAAFGIILGLFIKDSNTLFVTMKAIGILLYAPGFVYLFPGLPPVIGQVFPTYYIIAPVIEVTNNGAGWSEVLPELVVLALLAAAMVGAVVYLIREPARREAMA